MHKEKIIKKQIEIKQKIRCRKEKKNKCQKIKKKNFHL